MIFGLTALGTIEIAGQKFYAVPEPLTLPGSSSTIYTYDFPAVILTSLLSLVLQWLSFVSFHPDTLTFK